jgi:hypothetical protein
MIFASGGPLSPESRHLDRVSVREQVPKTAAEQDQNVEGLAEAELVDLDAQPAGLDEDNATDNTNDDY